MHLEIQIQTLIFSLLYGMFFSLVFNAFYLYIVESRSYIKIIINICVLFLFSIIYFLVLVKINNGAIHIYLFIFLIIGFFIGNNKTKKKRKISKK